MANYLKAFRIQHIGLDLGAHRFDFEIDDKFFECFEYSEIHSGQVAVTVDVEKSERMMVLDIHFAGSILTQCDHCGDDFLLPIEGREQLIVKLGDHFEEGVDDVIVIPETDPFFDLSSYLYEFIHLARPIQAIHPVDANGNSTCNPDALKYLSEHSAGEETDPRWDALKRLKDTN